MKIVIAPDSYKESLSATQVAQAIEKGFREIFPDAEYVSMPVADGGEGTVDAMITATQGVRMSSPVTGPLGQQVMAEWVFRVTGKPHLLKWPRPAVLHWFHRKQRNPLLTTSRGTGELILHALEKGAQNIIIGIGGSATNDGGAGMVQALGARLTDEAGEEIGFGGGSLLQLRNIDISNMDSRLAHCVINVACDVTNPLLGEYGASRIFGPQKGRRKA